MYYQWQSVRGGPRTFWYFGYFLTIWAFLSKQLTGHKQFIQNYKIMIQWRNIISFDFHHIPKLSIVSSTAMGPKVCMQGAKLVFKWSRSATKSKRQLNTSTVLHTYQMYRMFDDCRKVNFVDSPFTWEVHWGAILKITCCSANPITQHWCLTKYTVPCELLRCD